MMSKAITKAAPLLSLLALVAWGAAARANTVQVNNAGFTDVDSDGNFEFVYSATLLNVPPSELRSGDFFVIYDFEGFTGQSYQPTDWTLTYADTPFDPTQGGLINVPANNHSIGDLKWTYSGATLNTSPAVFLGLFGAETTATLFKAGAFTGVDHNSTTGLQQSNNGPIVVASLDPNNGTSFLPLPPAAFAGMGLLGLLGGSRLRKRGALIAD